MKVRTFPKVVAVAAVILTLAIGIFAIQQVQPMASPLVATTNAAQAQTVYLYMDILPGFKLGPDGKYHDAFSSWQMKVPAGAQVVLTVYNWDDMGHSFTSKELGVDVVFKPALKQGEPSATVIKFTAPQKPGTYEFHCKIPCDLENGEWSMSHQGYMIGQIVVVAP